MKWFRSEVEKLIENGSDEELDEEYEKRRVEWLGKGGGDKTPEMERINNEISRRMNDKYEREHPDSKPRYREHGWYLPNDDDD